MKTIKLNFKCLYDLQKAFPTEKSCIRYLERKLWADGVVSPYDPTSKVYKRKDGQYRCKNTGKNFNVLTGTFMEGTKLPLRKWFQAIYQITNNKKGISATQLAKDIGVTVKTAWFMAHRIRTAYQSRLDTKLNGEVELDETFVGGKNKNRHWDKKVKKCQGRSFKDKTPVMGMLERGGRVVCKVVRNTSYKSLTAPILRNVDRSTTLYMDEWGGYKTVQRVYKHGVVDHGHGIYVKGGAYTNNIEAFWGNFCKRAMEGTYNHVSRKHMQRYFDEFAYCYNTRDYSEVERWESVFSNCRHRLTYNQLINSK